MDLITETAALAAFCQRLAKEEFITVDTEFIRESTFWPVLCVVQVGGDDEARAIDALAPGIDLAPLFELLEDTSVLKVFHAARQDIEIFHHLTGNIPAPLFDSQIAAMVCGFGDSVGYETLVKRLAKSTIDKTSRFTDWSARPLTEKQLNYAIGDVTHLRKIYRALHTELDRTGRASWVEAEMAELSDPALYLVPPENAWRRLKVRSNRPQFLAVLRELAAWRERTAHSRDVPRNRVLRDESLMEIAAHPPKSADQLARTRGLSKGAAHGSFGRDILAAVKIGLAVPEKDSPKPLVRNELPKGLGPVVELLKVLLKMKCEEFDVAQKLVATTRDIEAIAADDTAEVPALKGWRRDVFGNAALDLKHGKLALTVDGKQMRAVPVEA